MTAEEEIKANSKLLLFTKPTKKEQGSNVHGIDGSFGTKFSDVFLL
jgi:hypothetical protein